MKVPKPEKKNMVAHPENKFSTNTLFVLSLFNEALASSQDFCASSITRSTEALRADDLNERRALLVASVLCFVSLTGILLGNRDAVKAIIRVINPTTGNPSHQAPIHLKKVK